MLKDEKIMKRYSTKMINPKFYGNIQLTEQAPLLKGEDTKEGYVYAPYIPITIKTIMTDENGTHVVWQISKWMRFKLWFLGLIGKVKKIG